jgi:acetyl esterase/lipase
MPRLPMLLSLLLVAAMQSGCQSLYFTAVNAGGDARSATVAYGPAPMQKIDIYRPPGSGENAPVVLFLYGSRWEGGRREHYAFVGKKLAAHGVLALVADYRQYPDVRFPVFVQDAARALQWAQHNSGAYGGDPRRLFVVGHSAGAHIAALLATDARYLAAVRMRPRDLRGVVGIAGPYDFLPFTEADLRDIFGPEPQWPDSQPVNFVDGDEPPMLLLHGSDDRVVWPRNSERLAQRLRTAGDRVEHRVYPGLGHVRIVSALRYPSLAPTLEDTLDFVLAPR